MKILLSAYACEPGLGSEAAVGWGWATHLAQGHEVHVITRESNRLLIEAEITENPVQNLYFHYFDLPAWARKWKKGNRGVHLYYLFWQYGAYKTAKKLHQPRHFDIVHHVTFVSARFPSFMGKLGIPFVFGPVAGGEHAPIKLWWALFGLKAKLKELVRSVSILWIKKSFLLNKTFSSATAIVTTSRQSTGLIPVRHTKKVKEMLAIALSNKEFAELHGGARRVKKTTREPFKVFFAGRLLYWKGMDLGIRAFARLCGDITFADLTIIGNGPAYAAWKNLASDLGVSKNIHWVSQMSRIEFLNSLSQFDVLLFPSLHDSGGMVILEAMAAGVPTVCLDIGGPGILVDDASGFRIRGNTGKSVVNGLYKALLQLATEPEKRIIMGKNSADRIHTLFLWEHKIAQMENIYRAAIASTHGDNV